MDKISVNFIINEKPVCLMIKPYARLLDVIREELMLTGTKEGCGIGECGACTVIADGVTINSCLALAASMEGKHITTIEGVARDGELHPIQEAFVRHNAIQCGFCTPGLVLSAKTLLDANPNPTRDEIKMAISGNLCRCTGYRQVIEAIEDAAQNISSGDL